MSVIDDWIAQLHGNQQTVYTQALLCQVQTAIDALTAINGYIFGGGGPTLAGTQTWTGYNTFAPSHSPTGSDPTNAVVVDGFNYDAFGPRDGALYVRQGRFSYYGLTVEGSDGGLTQRWIDPQLTGSAVPGLYVEGAGAVSCRLSFNICGVVTASAFPEDVRCVLPTTDPCMLALGSDVVGPVFVARTVPGVNPGQRFFDLIEGGLGSPAGYPSSGNKVFSIAPGAVLQWGSPAPVVAPYTQFADQDTFLQRLSAGMLQTPGQFTIGNASAQPAPTSSVGLHIVGGSSLGNQLYADTQATGFVITASRTNTSFAAPSGVLTGQPMFTLNATGYGSTTIPATAPGMLQFLATENWTDAARGTKLQFTITKAGGTARTIGLSVNDDGTVQQNVFFNVANLPAATAGNKGARTFVNDALAPVAFAAVAGGGAVFTPVYSTGAAWLCGA